MFVIINIVETGKKKIKRGKTVNNVRDVHMSGGERFYIVDVCDSEKGVNWDEVSYFVGKHSKRVLTDKQICFSEFSAMERFNAVRFKNILLFNTLEMILRELYLSGMRIRCVVNDPQALYVQNLPKIVRFAARTTVVTENNFRYFAEISDIYAKFGAGITVADVMPETDEKTLILDTSGDVATEISGYLFSAQKAIRPVCVDGFSHLKSLCPSYIDHIDFLGAMYEMNNEKSLSGACCSQFSDGCGRYTVQEMIASLKRDISAVYDNNKSIIFYV